MNWDLSMSWTKIIRTKPISKNINPEIKKRKRERERERERERTRCWRSSSRQALAPIGNVGGDSNEPKVSDRP